MKRVFLNTKRLVTSIIGINVLALGMAFLMSVEYALDSFDSLAYFLQNLLGMSTIGNAIFLLHVIFWIVYILLIRDRNAVTENIVSIGSVFVITRVIDFYIQWIHFTPNYTSEEIVLFICGFVIVNFGLYLIAISDFFIPPYDKLVVHLAKLKKIEIGKMRQLTDLLIIASLFFISLFTSNLVLLSLGTLIFGFGTGQNIKIYERLFNSYYENL